MHVITNSIKRNTTQNRESLWSNRRKFNQAGANSRGKHKSPSPPPEDRIGLRAPTIIRIGKRECQIKFNFIQEHTDINSLPDDRMAWAAKGDVRRRMPEAGPQMKPRGRTLPIHLRRRRLSLPCPHLCLTRRCGLTSNYKEGSSLVLWVVHRNW